MKKFARGSVTSTIAPVSAALIPRMAMPLAILSTAAISYVASVLAALIVRRVSVIGKWIC